jgi:Rieske Fe-S protein
VARSVTHCCDTAAVPGSAVCHVSATEIAIDLRGVPDLMRKGSSAKIMNEANGIDVLVFRDREGRYRAFSRRCTHGPGALAYNPGKDTVQCTCWGHSEYAFDGSVLGGPAKKNLPVYEVDVKERYILRIRMDGGRL